MRLAIATAFALGIALVAGVSFAMGRWYEYRSLNRTWRSIPRKARRNFIADARGWEREP